MIENPKIWFDKCCKYAVPNHNSIVYGDLFLLQENVSEEVKKAYEQYIDLLKKVYINPSFLKIIDKEIIDIQDNLSPKGFEQARLTMLLIKNGFLKSQIFKLRLNNQAP